MTNFNLGDSAFNEKMMRLYRWIMPVVFGGLCILFVLTQAWLSAIMSLLGVLITLPPLSNIMEDLHMKGSIKVVACILLVIAAMYATGLYV